MIGSRVFNQLIEQNHIVAGLDNLSSGWMGFLNQKGRFFNADIRSLNNLKQIFNIFMPEVVIHLAAVHHIPTCEKVRQYALDVNILGTENILECIKTNQCKKVIIASSGAVYDWKDGMLSEDDNTSPCDNYSISKLTNEFQLKIFSKLNPNIQCCVLRLFNAIAFDDPNAHLIPDIMNQISKKNKTQNISLGNIKTIRDYSHAEDIAKAIVSIASTPKIKEFTYNVCSSFGYTAEDIINVISKIWDLKININLDKQRLRKVDRPSQVGENKRLINDFPNIKFMSLEKSIEEILKNY